MTERVTPTGGGAGTEATNARAGLCGRADAGGFTTGADRSRFALQTAAEATASVRSDLRHFTSKYRAAATSPGTRRCYALQRCRSGRLVVLAA
jgi:hypothetical protein